MPLVAFPKGAPRLFGPSKPSGPLKKPRVTVDTKLVESRLNKLIPEVKKQFAVGLNNLAEETVTVIMDRAPVDTGDLQASVRREKVRITKTTVMVPIKAGGIEGESRGEPINYAITVHELGSPLGRGRFFVIEPALQMGELFLPRMADAAITRAVRAVGGK